jgi:hypothetical protein
MNGFDVAYWHFCDLDRCPLCGRFRGKADISHGRRFPQIN